MVVCMDSPFGRAPGPVARRSTLKTSPGRPARVDGVRLPRHGARRAAAPTLRVRLDLAYDGTDFSGWAQQPGLRTVEGTLSAALATVLRLPGPPRLTVAGRTDAGVHARGQVVHVDVTRRRMGGGARALGPRARCRARSRLGGVLPPTSSCGGRAEAARRLRRAVRRARAALPLPHRRRRRRHVTRCAGATPCGGAVPSTSPPWTRPPRAWSGLRDFAAFCRRREGATTDPHPARVLVGPPRRRRARGARCAPTRSATRWCARSSVPSCRWGRAGAPPTGRGRCSDRAVRRPRVHVMPPHGLSLEEVLYPPDEELAARAVATRARARPPPD